MMVLTLIRDTFTPSETLGRLYIDRAVFCDTLEPPDAQHPKGCIPLGWYRLSITRSPKFGRLLPLLHQVPGFEGIRIHAGNNRDHTSGCILVGKLYSRPSAEEYSVPTLYRSRATEETLVKRLIRIQNNHEEIYIHITTADRYSVEHATVNSLPDNPGDDAGYRPPRRQ